MYEPAGKVPSLSFSSPVGLADLDALHAEHIDDDRDPRLVALTGRNHISRDGFRAARFRSSCAI